MNALTRGTAMRLADSVAIVTGSSLGIGLAIGRRMLEEGASVVLNSRSGDSLEQAAAELRNLGGRVVAVAADVGTIDGADRLFHEAVGAFGRVDILVNNAAWATPRAHLLEMDLELWSDVLRTNLTSVYLCANRVATLMVDDGIEGSIVNVSSFAASRSHRNMTAYDSSKGGLEAFTRAAALDLAPFGIRVNAVGPGDIRTERLGPRDEEEERSRGATVPLGRVGESEEVAAAVAFLASSEASYITGQVLYVDGGVLAQLRSPQVDHGLPDSVAARLPKRVS